jgi:hypothetical protein
VLGDKDADAEEEGLMEADVDPLGDTDAEGELTVKVSVSVPIPIVGLRAVVNPSLYAKSVAALSPYRI